MPRLLLAAIFALLVAAPAALAQTCTTSWTRASGGAWEIDGNWSNGAPGPGDTACITLDGTYTVAQSTANRTIAGLVVGGASGTQTLTVINAFTVQGNAVVRPNGRWQFQNRTPGGEDGLYATGTVLVEGEVRIPGGVSFLTTGGLLDVAPGGTLRLVDGGDAGGATALLRIRGTLDASCPPTSSGFCTVNAPVDVQGGTIRITTPGTEGRLDVRAGGTVHDATFDAGPGTTLYLTDDLVSGGRPFTLTGTVSGNPIGTVYWSGVNLAAGAGGATLAMGGTGLQLTGSAFLTSAGGAFTNTGLLRKADTGSNFSGFRAVVVTNRAMVDFASFQLLDGAVLRNEVGATILLPAGGGLSGDGRLDNAGLIVRQGNRPGIGGTYSFGGLLRSLPGSEIRSNEDRVDLQTPASRSIPEGTTLTGTGQFLFNGEIEGAVSPGTAEQPLAELDFFSVFRLSLVSGSPRVVIDVDAGGRSDTLTIGFGSGGPNTVLGGALVVRVRPGFTPAVGDQWTVLTTESPGGITGQFGQVVAEGAPSGIAFVAERSADGASLVLRAVATAPGGPVTVSATRVVGGSVRPIFLTGPGAAGITAARLECTECLDADAFGTIPAALVGTGALREVQFDLTSPRAFGFYNLVLQQPGLPDEVVPVTVRPYLGYVVTDGGLQRGARVRPPGNGYNWTHYRMTVRTNTDAPAFALPRVYRRDSTLFALALATGTPFSTGVVLYESDAAPDPTRAPLMIGRMVSGAATQLSYGLRINPENVRSPGQPLSGPDDVRVPFGDERQFAAAGVQHFSQARASAAVGEALRTSGNAALTDYIASVDAADAGAVASAFNTGRVSGQTYFTVPRDVLGELLAELNLTVAVPAGLAQAAGDAFAAALERTAFTRYAEIEAAHVEALNGAPANVAELFDDESQALFPEGFSRDGRAAGAGRSGDEPASPNLWQRFLCFLGFGPAIQSVNAQTDPFARYDAANSGGGGSGGGGGGGCGEPQGSADPNDKLAESTLTCQFGTVIVDGQPQTRCVRYFVPRAAAVEPVFYSVAFENVAAATAPAEFVTITDEIDPNLDLASLRIEGTSSDSTFSYSVSGRTVTFRFVGIDLPPNRTAPQGEGFVRFSLRPTAGLPDGTEIRNDASIVFDFNPAIATPEVLHEIRTVADIAAVISAPDFVVVGTAPPITVDVSNLRGDVATAAGVTISTGGAAAQVTPSSGACTGAGPFVCTFGDLPAGETATVDVAFASAPAGTALTVSATATTTAFDGFAANDTDLVSIGVATVGTEADPDVPRELTLSSPRPNPARGATTLRWGLPAASSVDVRVYDLLGREVARLADGEAQEAGWHEARWEAQVASGVYVVRVRVGDDVRTRRLTVIR